MSLDTLFDVWPSCLLALPTALITPWTSTPGTGTPSTFRRLSRPFNSRPPATPAAAAAAATAGLRSVSTTRWLPCELALDPFERGVLCRRLAAFGLAPLPDADAFVDRSCADCAPPFAE